MFFMMGVTPGRKLFEHFNQLVICDRCGAYGRYQVFMTYMCLSIFFIPCFKWGKKYYVQTSCCNTVYELDMEIGRQIAAGGNVKIEPEHLTLVQQGNRSRSKRCESCGYETQEDFEFCPKCGSKLM